jgi:hypothetical protein
VQAFHDTPPSQVEEFRVIPSARTKLSPQELFAGKGVSFLKFFEKRDRILIFLFWRGQEPSPRSQDQMSGILDSRSLNDYM